MQNLQNAEMATNYMATMKYSNGHYRSLSSSLFFSFANLISIEIYKNVITKVISSNTTSYMIKIKAKK